LLTSFVPSSKVLTMKNILTFILTISAIQFNCAPPTSAADTETTQPELPSTIPDTPPTWTVEITPAPGPNSYATRKISFPVQSIQTRASSTGKSDDSIIILPRPISAVPTKPECATCNHRQRKPMNRSAYCNSWPWSRSRYYANQQSNPALDLYSDLVRSNWFGSPYQGHTFYYNGYRPSFRFGSLQFRGFGNYDRMYNPRIIPFGYQYTGSRSLFAALALAEQYGF